MEIHVNKIQKIQCTSFGAMVVVRARNICLVLLFLFFHSSSSASYALSSSSSCYSSCCYPRNSLTIFNLIDVVPFFATFMACFSLDAVAKAIPSFMFPTTFTRFQRSCLQFSNRLGTALTVLGYGMDRCRKYFSIFQQSHISLSTCPKKEQISQISFFFSCNYFQLVFCRLFRKVKTHICCNHSHLSRVIINFTTKICNKINRINKLLQYSFGMAMLPCSHPSNHLCVSRRA